MGGDDAEAPIEAPIVRLVTARDAHAEAVKEYEENATGEAIAMLERVLAELKARPVGQRASSVAIAVAYEDGAYGSLIPLAGDKLGHLIGAIADMQYRLLRLTNGEPTR